VFLAIILAGFISAAPLQLSNLLGNIAEGTLVILLVFIISFALIFFALNRTLKQNIPIVTVISFAMAFGITYWVNKSGFDLSGWVYDLGISSEILSILIPVVAIALTIFLILKLKKNSLFVLGGLFIASSIFVYEKSVMIIIGIALIVVRLFIGKGRWGKDLWDMPTLSWPYSPYSSSSSNKEYKQALKEQKKQNLLRKKEKKFVKARNRRHIKIKEGILRKLNR
jgi:hypothetical protein